MDFGLSVAVPPVAHQFYLASQGMELRCNNSFLGRLEFVPGSRTFSLGFGLTKSTARLPVWGNTHKFMVEDDYIICTYYTYASNPSIQKPIQSEKQNAGNKPTQLLGHGQMHVTTPKLGDWSSIVLPFPS